MDKDYDIIIAGAGISGLLLASQLSPKFRILLIEEKDDIQFNKYWVTLKECLTLNPFLNTCIDNEFHEMLFADAYGNNYFIKGEYILWNTVKLLSYLKNKVLENGSNILFSERFCGYREEKNHIKIFSNNRKSKAKLFVDCMGYGSPLVLAEGMMSLKGYYLLYGSKLKLKKDIAPICLSNYLLSEKPKYFEVFPTGRNEAYAAILQPSLHLNHMNEIAKDFDFFIKKSIYSTCFDQKNYVVFKGIVPVGSIRKKSLNRIMFFGESAQNHPAATGTCLTRLLINHKSITDFIEKKIHEDKLTSRDLSEAPEIMNSFVRNLQLRAYMELLSCKSRKFSEYIKHIPNISDEILNKFIFGSLEAKDFFQKKRIRKIFMIRNLRLLSTLIKSFYKI